MTYMQKPTSFHLLSASKCSLLFKLKSINNSLLMTHCTKLRMCPYDLVVPKDLPGSMNLIASSYKACISLPEFMIHNLVLLAKYHLALIYPSISILQYHHGILTLLTSAYMSPLLFPDFTEKQTPFQSVALALMRLFPCFPPTFPMHSGPMVVSNQLAFFGMDPLFVSDTPAPMFHWPVPTIPPWSFPNPLVYWQVPQF